MKKTAVPRFSAKTLAFLEKAGRQKNPNWLERNYAEYEAVLLLPLKHLAGELVRELRPLAPDYHFPLKGIGRLKRPAHRVAERGGGMFRDWMTYSAARPRKSRFEHNPNLYLLINSDDPDDSVLVAGGLYMPSSQQTRALREALSKDTSAFDRLFKSKDFARRFPGGFSREKISSRVPRGFDPGHPKIDWIKLQAFFVWRGYSKKEFASAEFPALVARDWKQILRMNRLLEQVLSGKLRPAPEKSEKGRGLLQRLEDIELPKRQMDF